MNSGKFDAVAWVGQHARSGSLFAHLAHTGTIAVCEDSINGIPLGEFGVLALCAGELGLPVIFGSGDRAFTEEAQALAPGLETAAVKHGLNRDSGYHLPTRAYARHTLAAVHIGVEAARTAIRTAAGRAGERLVRGERFSVVKMPPPYRRVTVFRSDEENPPRVSINEDPKSIIALLNQPRTLQVLDKADPRQFV
ncbi:MAG: D-aminopeptidase [candidate division TA06 bacterium ADurb.Bin417]|uniref:D-aminopeptidase n=1 Tax=candidate division TA06 bacterium ADurb.Bin417 TaxID=1852828 RepID=A0A1V5MHI4_UNCT6|nr:MAG: D-aminopeptidase [candidate division TA06 bacterium ADurb.Bin417]